MGMQKNGKKIVFLLRVSGVIPFVVLNYILSVTDSKTRLCVTPVVRFVDYVIGNIGFLIGLIPFVYFAMSVTEFSSALRGETPWDPTMISITVVGTILCCIVAVLIGYATKKELNRMMKVQKEMEI